MTLTNRVCSLRRAVLAVLTLTCLGCNTESMPEELLGRWTAEDPRYEGRAFELTNSTIRIFTSPNEFTQHGIRGIENETLESGDMLLTIDYDAPGGSQQFAVAYEPPGSDGLPGWVHLSNQPDFEWTRSDGGS